jgi:DNA polymerase-3 subunit epsilon
MKLKLTRPLAFFDLEATGLNTQNDRIVEIAICKIFPDYTREVISHLVNPQMPIPAEASAIHGIFDHDVADAPTFQQLAPEIWNFIDGCDIGGFNSNSYDVPMLFNEFIRAGKYWDYQKFAMVDAGNIFKRKEQRTLSAAYKFYCGTELENAHSAEADILATVDVFVSQFERYPDLPSDIDGLQHFCNYDRKILDLSGKFTLDNDGDIVFNFGSKKGTKAKQDLGYVSWMYGKDFAPDTMRVCEELLGINQ